MRVDFPQGVPAECTVWLNQHVGKGNITGIVDDDEYAWFYERRFETFNQIKNQDEIVLGQGKYIPSITVKDPEKAVLFVLRWS